MQQQTGSQRREQIIAGAKFLAQGRRMRRMATILAVAVLTVTFSSGVALATFELSITGTDGHDNIMGTAKAEHISGLGGGDRIHGHGGNDLIEGGKGLDELGDGLGQDTVYGGSGPDYLIGQGGDTSRDRYIAGRGDDNIQPGDKPAAVEDVVNCGPGTDTVYADKADIINANCERVSGQ